MLKGKLGWINFSLIEMMELFVRTSTERQVEVDSL